MAWRFIIVALTMAATPAIAAEPINTMPEISKRIAGCFKPPRLAPDHPGLMITVMVSFTRSGELFGKPKVTYESDYASDDDRLLYRTAVMEALQRCTPMPFTAGLGDAVAGRPLRIRLDNRRTKSI